MGDSHSPKGHRAGGGSVALHSPPSDVPPARPPARPPRRTEGEDPTRRRKGHNGGARGHGAHLASQKLSSAGSVGCRMREAEGLETSSRARMFWGGLRELHFD